jgi:hypothetical protein
LEEKEKEGKKIIFCGHSLGGAIAILSYIKFKKENNFCITFASPLVGAEDFSKNTQMYHKNIKNFYSRNDIVPKLLVQFKKHEMDKRILSLFDDQEKKEMTEKKEKKEEKKESYLKSFLQGFFSVIRSITPNYQQIGDFYQIEHSITEKKDLEEKPILDLIKNESFLALKERLQSVIFNI